ncbi:hypothetical protein VTK56DRAFT_6182 [Thermocarpiscus australiensis]
MTSSVRGSQQLPTQTTGSNSAEPELASSSPRLSPSVSSSGTTTTSHSSHRGGAFACTRCSRVFETRRKLSQHERYHKKRYCCTIPGCVLEFSTAADLKRHRNTLNHGCDETFQCPWCPKTRNRPDNLRAHIKKAHGGLP